MISVKSLIGNVPGVSTSHYILNLLHFLHVGAEESHNFGTVVLTDFSKAFDLLNHTVLIDKIIEMGVNRNIVPWVCDFLDHRQQCVRYNCDLSDYVLLSAGVPQGTTFGPIGFQIIINNAANNAKSQYWKYVDDLTFAENRKIFETGELQKDLNEFSDWAKDNQLKLNPSKCQALEVCFKNGAPLHADIMIGTEKLPCVNKAKALGLWLQCDINYIGLDLNTTLNFAYRKRFRG